MKERLSKNSKNIKIKFKNCQYIEEELNNLSQLETAKKKNNTLVKINDIDKYYLFLNNKWNEILYNELNQNMKIYEINGDFEMRGKRQEVK